MIYHDYTPEIYIITSGSGVLTTGGVIDNKKAGTGVPNVMNGPSGNGTAGAGAYSRVVQGGRHHHHPDRGRAMAGARSPIT